MFLKQAQLDIDAYWSEKIFAIIFGQFIVKKDLKIELVIINYS